MSQINTIINKVKYRYLRPVHIYESIYDIDFGMLYDDGIRSLLIDIDNTLISYSEKDVSLQCINLFNSIKSLGFESIILFSNNSSLDRVGRVAKQLNLPSIAFACKPFVFTARRVMNDYSMTNRQTAIIGDQLLTDVLLGSFMNLTTIYVDPISCDSISYLKLY